MFHVGQHVLCIKGRPKSWRLQGYGNEVWPVKGTVYTVRDIRTYPYDGVVALLLHELHNPPRPYNDGMQEFAFADDGFRPLSRSALDQLLQVPAPVREDA